MIGDAWDVRAARKLSEMNLITIQEVLTPIKKQNVWNITDRVILLQWLLLKTLMLLKPLVNDQDLNNGLLSTI